VISTDRDAHLFKESTVRILLACAIAGIAVLMAGGAGATADAADEAAAVVTAFNAALSKRDLGTATGLLAPGGVQLTLRPSHTGLGGQPQGALTSELRGHWSTIAPVLYSATTSYSRRAEITGARADGDLATVWTRIATESVHPDKTTTRAKFVEVYLLVRKDGAWKIAAMGDNRNASDVGLGGKTP